MKSVLKFLLFAFLVQFGSSANAEFNGLSSKEILAVVPPDELAILKAQPGFDRWIELIDRPGSIPKLSKSIKKEIEQRALEAHDKTQACKERKVTKVKSDSRLTADREIDVAIRGGFLLDAWKSEVIIDSCGTEGYYPFLVTKDKDKKLTAYNMFPGVSLTSPSLQKQMVKPIVSATAAALTPDDLSCSDPGTTFNVIQSFVNEGQQLPASEHGAVFNGSWEETWFTTICDIGVVLNVRFNTVNSNTNFAVYKFTKVQGHVD